MKVKEKLDHGTVQEMERFLRDKHSQLKESVRNTRQCANRASRPADSAVWAAETLDEEIRVTLMDRASRQLTQVEAALERLGQQEYGICHDCEEFIGLARLRAMPFAQRCQPCQSRAERQARPELRPVSVVFDATDDDD